MSLTLDLVNAFGWSGADIRQIIGTAPARYKVYPIPKRSGAGVKIIAQPSRELKAIQHFILLHKLSGFVVHPKALAYARGKNIRANAQAHVHSNVTLKLDFSDFFPSIKVSDWEQFARAHPNPTIDLADLKLYSKVMFWGQEERRSIVPRCLSIGAPTSPALSNVLMHRLDMLLSAEAEKFGIVYTRYADDITVSGETAKPVLAFEKSIRRIIKSTKSPRLKFNDEKRGLYTKGQRRMVTGLVVTPTRSISIGRERKRLITVMLHKASIGQLSARDKSRLKGWLGFTLANEPDFIARMREKYGNDVVDASLAFHAPRRSELGLQG